MKTHQIFCIVVLLTCFCFSTFAETCFAQTSAGMQQPIGRSRPQAAPADDDKPPITLPGRRTVMLKVPNVVGLQYPEAAKRLEAAGFKNRFSTKGVKQIRNGVVISIIKRQDTAGGATVPNGTNLKLFF